MAKRKKRYDREASEWEKGWADLKEEYTLKGVIIGTTVTFLIASIVSGYMLQSLAYALGFRKSIIITELPKIGLFSIPGIILTLMLTYGVINMVFWIRRRYRKDYHTDRDRNYHISDIHSYGDADYQDENEIKRCFFRTDDPTKVYHNLDILGRGLEDKQLYSVRDDLKSMNGHMAIFGSSGSGKSAAFVKNKIYQGLKRGVSMIITDSKGDLYADTARLAHDYHYKVRVLNLKSSQLMNSDGCDFLKTLGDDDTKAGVLAETIIKNTEGDEKLDYWAKNEMNLIKALMLYVSTNKQMIKMHKNNLAEIYNLVSTKSLEELHAMFGLLQPSHPAKQAFNLFAQCEPKIQGQIVNGMGIRLQILSNKWARKIVSSDEIDLIEPMKSKCIYYVVISDTETAYKFIATLFFAELFIELCAYYDYESQRARSKGIENKCLPVDFILDEYANTGAIPEMNVKVATVRSRQIGITIIIQDIGQLKDMYGENLAYTILNNMPLKMLLKTTDINTAKYFSDLMGIQTVRVEQRRYEKKATDIVDAHDSFTVSEGQGKRPLMNPDELINSLDNDHLILCVSGFHPVKLKKFLFFEHPMTEECKFTEPGRHTPKWRKKMDAKRAEEGLGPAWLPPDAESTPPKRKKMIEKPKRSKPPVTNENPNTEDEAPPVEKMSYSFDEDETTSPESDENLAAGDENTEAPAKTEYAFEELFPE